MRNFEKIFESFGLDDVNQTLLNSIICTFTNYKAKTIKSLRHGTVSAKRSAVSIILRAKCERLEVLFLKRPIRKGDRWSGQVCFPGGKYETTDKTLLETAIRETREEIGIDLCDREQFALLGRVDDHMAQGNMPVSCFVFLWFDVRSEFNPNVDEVDGMRWVPLQNFLATGRHPQRLGTSGNQVLNLNIGLVYPNLQNLIDKDCLNKTILQFPTIDLPVNPHDPLERQNVNLRFKLWGLTLRILTKFLYIIDPKLPIVYYDYDLSNPVYNFIGKNFIHVQRKYLTVYEEAAPSSHVTVENNFRDIHREELEYRLSKL